MDKSQLKEKYGKLIIRIVAFSAFLDLIFLAAVSVFNSVFENIDSNIFLYIIIAVFILKVIIFSYIVAKLIKTWILAEK